MKVVQFAVVAEEDEKKSINHFAASVFVCLKM